MSHCKCIKHSKRSQFSETGILHRDGSGKCGNDLLVFGDIVRPLGEALAFNDSRTQR